MLRKQKIVPIILAAGSSRRLGIPKALAQFGRKTAIRIAVENCMGYEKPIVVLGCDADKIASEVPRRAEVVLNVNWEKGQLSSLLFALKGVPPSAAIIVYPVDHPLLLRRDVTQLVREYRQRGPTEEIVMPRYKKKYGHPIILSAALREELTAAKTTRDVVYRIPDRLRVFEANTSAIYEGFHSPVTLRKCVRKFLTREGIVN